MEATVNDEQNEELARVQTLLGEAGCDFALLSSTANVTYVSGYEVPLPYGPLVELAGGTPLALCNVHGTGSWLVVPDFVAEGTREQSRL